MNERHGVCFSWIFALILLSILAGNSQAAEETKNEPKEVSKETREFKLLLSGAERGKAVMKISVRDDGTEIMEGTASLEINYIVYKYAYASAGWEVWKDGKLVKLRNVANYNGDKYSLKGVVDGDKLVVEVNGKELNAPADTWATSYWKLPSPDEKPDEKMKKSVVLLDSDLGKKMNGELRFVETESLKIGDKDIESSHYQITGDVTVELWFDQKNRLVRSESVEMGQKTTAELVKITN